MGTVDSSRFQYFVLQQISKILCGLLFVVVVIIIRPHAVTSLEIQALAKRDRGSTKGKVLKSEGGQK
jgi:hypothetical protein